jgi:biopolymer transport protein ExbB
MSRFRSFAGFLVLLTLAASPFKAASASWWNGEWQYRVKIDADTGPKGANIGERVGRTQVLVRLLANNFKFDSAKPDGGDLRFIAADDKTPLHYHIEKWDGLVDEVALVWVDVPDIAPGATTNFTMYWGNSKANDASDPHATYDADQILVWHMAESSGPPKDSTAFSNNGQTPGRRDDSAIIGSGLKFDGSATENLALSPTLNITASAAYTWQAWVKLGTANETATLFEQRDTGGATMQVGFDSGAPVVTVTAGTANIKAASATPLTTESWHLITMVAAPEGVTLYVDGAAAAHVAGTLPAIAGQAVLGGGITPGATNFIGQIDELQISKAARPAGAIALADHSQGPQANLLSFEAPEETSSFGSGYFGIILRSVTADAWVVIGVLGFMLAISWLVMLFKGIYVSRVSGANRRFRKILQGVGKRARSEIMPALADPDARLVFASPLFRVYDVGQREVNERLAGGRTTPEGTIAPQSLAAIRSAMDAQMMRESQKLNAQMVFLTIAISGGPFVGLLGTVIGVMITFAAIAAQGDVNVNSIAPGISAALLATACGMFVAIPALFGYNYFQTRIKTVTVEMAVFVDEIVTRIAEGHLGAHATQLAE